jgi:hypothetical protein
MHSGNLYGRKSQPKCCHKRWPIVAAASVVVLMGIYIVRRKVTSQNISDGAVTNKDIKNGTIDFEKLSDSCREQIKSLFHIADNSVTNSKLADNSVTNSKLADNSVTNSKLADNSITNSKLADNTIEFEKLSEACKAYIESLVSTIEYQQLTDDCKQQIQDSIETNKFVTLDTDQEITGNKTFTQMVGAKHFKASG